MLGSGVTFSGVICCPFFSLGCIILSPFKKNWMAHWISHFLCVHLCCGTQSLCIASFISRVAAIGHHIRHLAPCLQWELNSYWEMLSHRKQLLGVVHRCRRWWSLNLQSLQSQRGQGTFANLLTWNHLFLYTQDLQLCKSQDASLSCFHWYNSFHFFWQFL